MSSKGDGDSGWGFPGLDAGPGEFLKGVGGDLAKGLGLDALASFTIPGIGPILGVFEIIGVKIPVIDGLLDDLIGGLVKHKDPDLPAGFYMKQAIRATGDGCYPDGDIIWSEEANFPVGRWSYERQEVWPISAVTRQGYCLFVPPSDKEQGKTHYLAGQDVPPWTGANAEALNALASEIAERAAELGIPGGIAGKRPFPVALVIAGVLLVIFLPKLIGLAGKLLPIALMAGVAFLALRMGGIVQTDRAGRLFVPKTGPRRPSMSRGGG